MKKLIISIMLIASCSISTISKTFAAESEDFWFFSVLISNDNLKVSSRYVAYLQYDRNWFSKERLNGKSMKCVFTPESFTSQKIDPVYFYFEKEYLSIAYTDMGGDRRINRTPVANEMLGNGDLYTAYQWGPLIDGYDSDSSNVHSFGIYGTQFYLKEIVDRDEPASQSNPRLIKYVSAVNVGDNLPIATKLSGDSGEKGYRNAGFTCNYYWH